MDHTAAEATFMEIAFGINVAFAFYDQITSQIKRWVENRVKEYKLLLTAKEAVHTDSVTDPVTSEIILRLLTKSSKTVDKIADSHVLFQTRFVPFGKCGSFIAGCLGVIVLYMDWLDWIGHWSALFLLPAGLYLSFSMLNVVVFLMQKHRATSELRSNERLISGVPKLEPVPDFKAIKELNVNTPPGSPNSP